MDNILGPGLPEHFSPLEFIVWFGVCLAFGNKINCRTPWLEMVILLFSDDFCAGRVEAEKDKEFLGVIYFITVCKLNVLGIH